MAPISSFELARRFYDFIYPKTGWLTASENALDPETYIRSLTLEQVIRAERRMYPALPTLEDFRVHHDRVIGSPGLAVRELVPALPFLERRVVLIEVNFDTLVETHSTTALRTFASDADFADAADYIKRYLSGEEDRIPLLKLHGTIEDFATCV